MLFHGTADGVVPYQWSVDTASALLKARRSRSSRPLQGAGHEPYDQYGQQFYEQSDYFFYDVLDLGHAAGQPATARAAADRLQRKMSARYPRFAHRARQRHLPARR